MNRKVLLIAYHYPPANNGGIARPLRLAKYLPRCGWDAVVLTCGEGGDSGPSGETVLRANEPFRRRAPAGGATGGSGRGFLKRLIKKHLLLPDGKRFWFRPALAAAKEFVKKEKVDCIVSTSPPETSHLVAMRLSMETGIPWVADFRDGWIFEPPRDDFGSSRRLGEMLKMESQVIRRAAAITSVTLPIHEDFIARYPERAAVMHYIPNGFDPESPPPLGAAPRQKRFRLLFTGRFSLSSAKITPRHLFEGLKSAITEKPEMARDCEFILMGEFTDEEKSLAGGLEGVIHWRTLGEPSEAAALQNEVAVNVLVTSRARRSVATGKLYEYLAARRPVLALAEGVEAERIIRETDSGLCVPPDDAKRISEAIIEMYDGWKDGTLDMTFSFTGTDRFSYETISRDFAAVLSDIGA